MKSKAYWKNRAAELERHIQSGAKKPLAEINKTYRNAVRIIDDDIRNIKRELAKLTGTNDENLNALLTGAERDASYAELARLLRDAENDSVRTEILRRMNAQAYGARITRLESVKNKIFAVMTRAAMSEGSKCKALFESAYQESYYTNIYELAKGYNVGVSFDVLPNRAINKALNAPWSGENYSDRIWNKSKAFISQVERTVTQSLITGQSALKTAAELYEYTDRAKYASERLVRTELTHFLGEGQREAYKAAGIENYRYLAALSDRTCDECAALDNKVFSLNEAQEGKNYPPMHPNCRCITVTADAELKSRIAKDPETGKNYKVDGNISFAEWKESLTDEQKSAFELHVRQYKNESTDRKQYARYIERLGKENMPKSFDLFQDLKYNNTEKWDLLKDYYKSRGTNMISAFTSFDDYMAYKKIISDEIIGLVTVDGVEIKGQSKHFIERVFGTSNDPYTNRPRDGVAIEDIKDTILNGATKHRKDSLRYFGNKCMVSVNGYTGALIQTNPV